MQTRSLTHQLTQEEIECLLTQAQTGVLSTIDPDGAPYGVPLHFVLLDGALYFHCRTEGEKTDNLIARPQVCFTVYEMHNLILPDEPRPCGVNTHYDSVIVRGQAALVEDQTEKLAALHAIVAKYTPQFADKELPQTAVDATAVVKITPIRTTGKYYK